MTDNISDFPQPFDENGESVVKYDTESDSVSMPLWYWIEIVEFAVDAKGVTQK